MRIYNRDELGRGRYTGCQQMDDLIIIEEADCTGEYAFAHSNVRKAVIGNVPTISKGTFYDCQNLEEVIFSNYVSRIEEEAFFNCAKLTMVKMSNRLVTIEDRAFEGGTGLEKIVLNDNLQVIGKKAFFGCQNLETIKLPSSLTKIDDYAFAECFNLQEVDFSGLALTLFRIWSAYSGENATSTEDVPTAGDVLTEKNNVISEGNLLEVGKAIFAECDKPKFFNYEALSYDYERDEYKTVPHKIMELFLSFDGTESELAKRILLKKSKLTK